MMKVMNNSMMIVAGCKKIVVMKIIWIMNQN